jgi:hypothetical protein
MPKTIQSTREPEVPSAHDWRTTDEQEIARRRLRARTEGFAISNRDPAHPIFSNFRVKSGSGMTYSVEIRDVAERQFACECVDFRINGLGTCKHIEAVLQNLEARFRRLFQNAIRQGSSRIDLVHDVSRNTLCLLRADGTLPGELADRFGGDGWLRDGEPEEALAVVERLRAAGRTEMRISQEVAPWLEVRRQLAERRALRREYELRVQRGEWPAHETLVPLFPYQREGMLHLAFTERALLADEMGLGKTIQAIAACALLQRLGQVERVLVVTPASLKTEWEEQIQRFTPLPYRLVFGGRQTRLRAYAQAPFFTIVNYEQMLADSLEVNQRLRPDVVILDEAQRIKNWTTKTTQAIKRLRSRYAFILTGTPLENRIDELYSLMDFLNPLLLGPLFRFNREFYALDDRGRPAGYRNLDRLHERIRPHLLRRRKADVETELPDRSDRNHFVPLSAIQRVEYENHEAVVARLASLARRRPLSQPEQDKLLRHLNMMRMVCDTPYILDPADRTCPKLAELEKILEECRDNNVKAIVFSEWERMLELVRDLCTRRKLGYAWHTGSVPQKRRRAEITLFKSDPACRVFLSTDSGAAGLNLQAASVVVNCDLPWNPAKLEQRIARAWRKHQTRAVTVINLVSERSIEERMLATLADKRSLADGVLDRLGDLKEIRLRTGKQAFLARLEQLMTSGAPSAPGAAPPTRKVLPADRAQGFAAAAHSRLDGSVVRCEERYPEVGAHSVLYVVVAGDAARCRPELETLHAEYFGSEQADPLAPVRLEVVDRATDEALQRLMAAGLIATTTRASRPLFCADEGEAAIPPLSTTEMEKARTLRDQASRKLKMARLLAQGELVEEARAALTESILLLGRALAVESRLPEPDSAAAALRPPLSHCWRDSLATVRGSLDDDAAPWLPMIEAIDRRMVSA